MPWRAAGLGAPPPTHHHPPAPAGVCAVPARAGQLSNGHRPLASSVHLAPPCSSLLQLAPACSSLLWLVLACSSRQQLAGCGHKPSRAQHVGGSWRGECRLVDACAPLHCLHRLTLLLSNHSFLRRVKSGVVRAGFDLQGVALTLRRPLVSPPHSHPTASSSTPACRPLPGCSNGCRVVALAPPPLLAADGGAQAMRATPMTALAPEPPASSNTAASRVRPRAAACWLTSNTACCSNAGSVPLAVAGRVSKTAWRPAAAAASGSISATYDRRPLPLLVPCGGRRLRQPTTRTARRGGRRGPAPAPALELSG